MGRTFLLTLHYDGGQFAGWQRQAAGRTVQGEVEATLERLAGGPLRVHAAGRTDAGVHASGMAVSCAVPDRWEAASLHRAINALLPADCWVERVQEMRPGFHARMKATGRSYRYLVGTDAAAAAPFRRRTEWALGRALDRDAMAAAAALLPGEHDFLAFSVRRTPRVHSRCRIVRAGWVERPEGAGLAFEIAGNRFLHHMVRLLVGTMVDIGLGRRPLSDMPRLLALDPACTTSPPAPAEGLCFLRADYPSEWFC